MNMKNCCCPQSCLCPLLTPEPEPKPEPKPLFRYLRVLEYVGTEDWIRECLKLRGVKYERVMPKGTIRELALATYEEVKDGK